MAVQRMRPACRGRPLEAWRSSSIPESASKVCGQPAALSPCWMKAAKRSRSTTGLSFTCTWIRRSEEHTSELQSLMRISYAVFCLKKKKTDIKQLTSKYKQHIEQERRQQ